MLVMIIMRITKYVFIFGSKFQSEEFEQKLKDIQSLKVPIWKLKPTERPQQPWYSEDLSIKRNFSGKRFTDDELERHERRDSQLKELEDPLHVFKNIL